MADLYAFTAEDTSRLRDLLAAWEQGRLRVNPPTHSPQQRLAPDTRLLQPTAALAPNATGLAYLCSVDDTVSPPAISTLSDTVTVWNTSPYTVPAAATLCVRDPTSSLWYPVAFSVIDTAYVVMTSATTQEITGFGPAYPATVPSNVGLGQPNAISPVWLLDADNQGLLLGWTYQARLVGAAAGVPVYAVANWPDASTTQRGFINTTTQVFAGSKFFEATYPSITVSNGISFDVNNSASNYIQVVGTNLELYSMGGSLTVTPWGVALNSTGGNCVYAIQGAGGLYEGASGTDGSGNQFLGGLCINVGGATIGGGGASSSDYGSYW